MDVLHIQVWLQSHCTAPVGSFAANRLGLHDLGGNAWEWCDDWFDEQRKDRALRDASWAHSTRGALLASYRRATPPSHRHYCVGFRVVLAPGP